MIASLAASRLKELMAELVRGEIDGMCGNVPQQGYAASPVQPCQVSTSHGQPLDATSPMVSYRAACMLCLPLKLKASMQELLPSGRSRPTNCFAES